MAQATTLYLHTSVAETASGNSGDISASNYKELTLDINITAITGTTPTIQFFVDRKGADGIYYPLWQSATQTTTGQTSTSIGPGLAYNQSLGATIHFRYVIAGTTPSITFSASLQGK